MQGIEIDEKLVAQLLPPRPEDAHKGSFGWLGILAGCGQYRGAALLAAEGALRSGAGIVQLASIEAVCAAAACRLPCCLLLSVPEEDGGIGPKGARLLTEQNRATAILAGCGMGQSLAGAAMVATLLETAACPVVLDADALNLLAASLKAGPEEPEAGRLAVAAAAFSHPLVITPHIGEMARLTGLPPEAVAAEQQVAMAWARSKGCTVVLKSHITLVAGPQGECYINQHRGNAGMAKGGSGDVLAGVIASLMAQGVPATKAAAAGVWLHAAAGDEAAKVMGRAGLSPADLPVLVAKEMAKLEKY